MTSLTQTNHPSDPKLPQNHGLLLLLWLRIFLRPGPTTTPQFDGAPLLFPPPPRAGDGAWRGSEGIGGRSSARADMPRSPSVRPFKRTCSSSLVEWNNVRKTQLFGSHKTTTLRPMVTMVRSQSPNSFRPSKSGDSPVTIRFRRSGVRLSLWTPRESSCSDAPWWIFQRNATKRADAQRT